MNERVPAALLACGDQSSPYVPALQAHPRFRLIALACDRPGRAAQIAEQRAIPHALDDWREAIADPAAELIVIVSPQPLREQQLRAALASGKHVLAEPPIAQDSAQLDALLEQARQAGVVAAAALWQRYLSAHQALRELVLNGHLGELRLATWRQVATAWDPDAPLHAADALRWTLGEPSPAAQRAEREATLLLQLRHDGGALSQLAIDGRAATEDFAFTVDGHARTAMIAGERPDAVELHIIEGDRDDEYAVRPSPYQRFAAAHRRVPPLMELLDELAAALAGRPCALPALADAAAAQRIAFPR